MLKEIDTRVDYKTHIAFMSYLVKELSIKNMAEVGVLFGAMSHAVLSKCKNIEKYYLVDSWKVFMDPPAYSQATWDIRYKGVVELMKQFGGRANIVRLDSIEAAKSFPDNSLDLVYLDANHSFEFVDADIKAWWPKVKSTGYIGGHDLTTIWHGVREAVETNFGHKYYCGNSLKGGKTSTWDGAWIVKKDDIKFYENAFVTEEHEDIHNAV